MNPRLITRYLLVVPPLLLFFTSLFAQERILTGKITDSKTNAHLRGATIKVKNGTQSAVSDEQGVFTIKVPSPEAVLSITYVGYQVYEIKAGTANTLSVPLTATEAQLEEYVVIGYGAKKKSDVIGSITTIKGETIEDLPVANLGTALKDRVPGVGISVASGKPGATTSLTIRGAMTFGNLGSSDPLYVIDGITLTKTDFDNLDASMVETITFLKDAAAAVYGAAGAKGVVLITTKKGKPGKAIISYTGSYGISDITKKPKVLSATEQMTAINDGLALSNPQPLPATQLFTPADFDSVKAHHYDWFDEVWQKSSLTRHTLNVSGGTEKITFFAGGNYYKETGNMRDLYIEKYGIRVGMTAKVTSDVTATISLNTDYTKNERPTYKPDQTDLSDQTMKALLLTPAWVPLEINGIPVYNSTVAWNPLALENSGTYNRTLNQGINLNASIDYRLPFIKGLTASVQYGKSNRSGSGKEFYVPYNTYDFARYGTNGLFYSNTVSATKVIANTNRLYEAQDYQNSYQLITSLNYVRRFGLHDFSVMAAAEQAEQSGDSYSIFRDIALIPGVDQFFAFPIASTQLGAASPFELGKRSYLGRLNYSYNNRYLLELIARYDGSANFPPNSRWGLFPALGLGWKISEEEFFKKSVPFVNMMKIRANIGLVGDDRTRNYQYRSRFSPTSGILFGTTPSNGLDNNVVPNPYITWEKSFTENIGFDASFLKNRLSFSMDVWKQHHYDALSSPTNALPFVSGIKAPDENYAIYDIWGLETTISFRDNINKNFSYFIEANLGRSRNTLVRNFQQASNVGTYQDVIGNPIGRVDGYISKGIIRTQGQVDAILSKNPNYTINGLAPRVGYLDFVDVNKDGKIDGSDITKLRSTTAGLFGMGLTFGFSYKTLRLSTNMNLSVGGYAYYDAIAKTPPSITLNAAAFWKDHWTPANPNAAFPSFDAPLAKETSSFWERNGTLMRVNNMVLSYGLPKSWAQQLHIPEFRLYLSANNLWTIINPFDYKDPSQSNFINYPTLRNYTLGLNMTL